MKAFLSVLFISAVLLLSALGLISWLDRLGIRKMDPVDPFDFANPGWGHFVLFALILASAIGIWKFYKRGQVDPFLKEQLVSLLHSMAFYNDKGYIWQNDSPEKSDKLRKEWRQEIDEIILKIGKENFPPEIYQMLQSPDLIEDGSGRYVRRFERWLDASSQK